MSVDALQLRGGAFYANNHYGLDRVVSFPGFYQTAASGYGGDTAEVFGEAGWRIAVAAPFVTAASVEPFVGIAGVSPHHELHRDTRARLARRRVGERGLRDNDAWAARRGDNVFAAPITLNAMIGWQHVYGGPTPNATIAFASPPSTPMSIAGPRSRATRSPSNSASTAA